MDATCCSTYVQGLTGVLFHMHTLDLYAELLWTFLSFDFNIEISIDTDWLVIL